MAKLPRPTVLEISTMISRTSGTLFPTALLSPQEELGDGEAEGEWLPGRESLWGPHAGLVKVAGVVDQRDDVEPTDWAQAEALFHFEVAGDEAGCADAQRCGHRSHEFFGNREGPVGLLVPGPTHVFDDESLPVFDLARGYYLEVGPCLSDGPAAADENMPFGLRALNKGASRAFSSQQEERRAVPIGDLSHGRVRASGYSGPIGNSMMLRR